MLSLKSNVKTQVKTLHSDPKLTHFQITCGLKILLGISLLYQILWPVLSENLKNTDFFSAAGQKLQLSLLKLLENAIRTILKHFRRADMGFFMNYFDFCKGWNLQNLKMSLLYFQYFVKFRHSCKFNLLESLKENF